MKKLRPLLIPLAILAEVIALIVCWTLVIIHKPTATRLTGWFLDVLPDRDWFTGGWRLPY